jgi:hypothetical protein
VSLCALPALAYLGGINGFSGKQGVTCSACHAPSGAAPTVTLTGPTTLNTGQTGDYLLTVTGGPAVKAGINVAAGPATLTFVPDNVTTRLQAFEITHNNPQPFVGGSSTFNFQMVAPTTPGTVTIYAAGLSSNNSGTNAGDNFTTRTLTVTVVIANQAPTIATPAAASPMIVTGTTASLSVLGADDNGEAALSYTWAATSGPAPVTFAVNGSNAAKATVATFSRAGAYTLAVSAKDVQGLAATSSVTVKVNATTTSVSVSPSTAGVAPSATQTFTAQAIDQFGQTGTAAFTWSVSGGGTVSNAGVFTASSASGGPYTVTASSGGKSGTAMVTVTAGAAPTIATPASAASASITSSSVAVSVLGADNGGEPGLTYTWECVGVSFAPNGTNAAKNSTATFSAPGVYPLSVTVKDATGLTATSTTTVAVTLAIANVSVSPQTGAVAPGGTLQFSATATDQFGGQISPSPTFDWTVAGGGTVSPTGLFRAGTVAGGPFPVTATALTRVGTATVQVGGAGAPTVAQPPTAVPSLVLGRTTTLHVMGAAEAGESTLSYAWSASGPAPVTFSVNGSNAAKNTVAQFSTAGTHTLTVTLTDAQGTTVSASLDVTVMQSLTTLTVSPAMAEVRPKDIVQFTAVAYDQFDAPMASPPTSSWAVGGGGAIDSNGQFSAAGASGPFTVSATSAGVRGLALVTIVTSAPATPGADTQPGHGQQVLGEWESGCSSAPSLLAALVCCLLFRRRSLP